MIQNIENVFGDAKKHPFHHGADFFSLKYASRSIFPSLLRSWSYSLNFSILEIILSLCSGSAVLSAFLKVKTGIVRVLFPWCLKSLSIVTLGKNSTFPSRITVKPHQMKPICMKNGADFSVQGRGIISGEEWGGGERRSSPIREWPLPRIENQRNKKEAPRVFGSKRDPGFARSPR